MDISEAAIGISTKPSFELDFSDHGQIVSVVFSPYEYSQEVILIQFSNKIIVGVVSFQDTFDFKAVLDVKHAERGSGIAISPETCIRDLPPSLTFCTAAFDFKLRLFKSDLKSSTCKVLSGHNNFINDISFDPDNNYLASTGDDHTVKIWNTDDYSCTATLTLTSAGVSLCWHAKDVAKLLVAEKVGLIRFYNVETQRPILSLDVGKPLSNAHWAPFDTQLVGSVQHGEMLLWDLTRLNSPTNVYHRLFTESGGCIKFSNAGELLAAVNQMDSVLKVIHIPTLQQRLIAKVVLPTKMAWHHRFPIVCLGDDTKLCFWKVTA